jgi:hypothetical protein
MARRFLRDNAFLIAAASLPILVVALFLLATAFPRWTVPPPAYDAVVRICSYDPSCSQLLVEFAVRDGKIKATLRPAPVEPYAHRSTLWLFDHRTMSVRQLPVDLPDQMTTADLPATITVDALKDRRVLGPSRAPDGYELRPERYRNSGLVGDLFGMGRRQPAIALVNRGRVVTVDLPAPYRHQSPVFVGWLADAGTR